MHPVPYSHPCRRSAWVIQQALSSPNNSSCPNCNSSGASPPAPAEQTWTCAPLIFWMLKETQPTGKELDTRDILTRCAHLQRRERSWTHTACCSKLLLHVTLIATRMGCQRIKKTKNKKTDTHARHPPKMLAPSVHHVYPLSVTIHRRVSPRVSDDECL